MKITINNKIYCNNSKEANNNTYFIYNQKTKQYIDDAKQQGCNNFIASSELNNHIDISNIKIIGITGTNGKTTTASLTYSILLDLGYKVALQGTRGFYINDKRIEKYSLTTPMQLETFYHIFEAKKQQCDFFVMEVSSHAIEQNRIEGLEFICKALTNITRDHLDYHKTIDEYIKIKNSFFQDDGLKLINKDEKNTQYSHKNCFTYGLENPATYKLDAYGFKDGSYGVVNKIGKITTFNSSLQGVFNLYNTLCAIGIVDIVTDKTLEEICNKIELFGGIEGRMEVVHQKPFVIIDFAHTPDGMKQVFNSFVEKNIIVVFGAGGDRDKQKRPLMGKIANNYAKQIILTSDNPRFEDPDKIIDEILSGVSDKSKVIIEINRKKAIKKAIGLSKDDDVVLILGKGDEEYQIIYDKKFPLKDKDIILNILGINNG